MTSVKPDEGVSISSLQMFKKSGLKTTTLVSAKYLKLTGSWEENHKKGILTLVKWDECQMKYSKLKELQILQLKCWVAQMFEMCWKTFSLDHTDERQPPFNVVTLSDSSNSK